MAKYATYELVGIKRTSGPVKRLTPRYRKWLDARRRWEAGRRRRSQWHYGFLTNRQGTYAARLGTKSYTPAVLCFDSNFEETAKFMDHVWRRATFPVRGGMSPRTSKHMSKLRVMTRYFDFSGVNRISTSAALVLASIYDVRRRYQGLDQQAVQLQAWNPQVRQTMRDLGFFALLGIEEAVPDGESQDVLTAKLREGMIVDPTQVGGPHSVLENIFAFMGMKDANTVPLYTAILEAMNNVRDHAYPEYYYHGRRHIKNWWFTASANRATGHMTVAFYDQGISIPVSLPKTRELHSLAEAFLRDFSLKYDPTDPKFDGQAIDAAMKVNATATRKANRGFGLAKIREMVDSLPGGRLRIISRHGEFVASAGQKPVLEFKNPALQGTLVEIEAVFKKDPVNV